MKKIIVNIVAIFMTVFAVLSCSESYPELIYNPNGNPNDNGEKVPAFAIRPTFDKNSISFSSTSRSTGAYDQIYNCGIYRAKYLKSVYYVLSYRKGACAEDGLTGRTDYHELMGSPTNANMKDCLVSTSGATNKGGHYGKPAMIKNIEGSVLFLDEKVSDGTTEELFYNKVYPNTGYNFSGYFFDDAKVNASVASNDYIQHNVTIDGSQDLMVGAAKELTMEVLEDEYPTYTEKEEIIKRGQGGYSAYTAQRGIQPKIEMKHLLTRLKFFALPKSETANDIFITGIKVKAHNTGNIIVASDDMSRLGVSSVNENVEWLELKDTATVDEAGNIQQSEKLKTVDISWDKTKTASAQPKYAIGESVMAFSDEEFELEVTGYQTKRRFDIPDLHPGEDPYENMPFTLKQVIKPNTSDIFEPGKCYLITFDVYGYQDIRISVSTAAWKDGGGLSIDAEE